jgi:hypothetical protein
MWAGLQYRDSTGKMKVVWPFLTMASPAVQITNNVAVLVGGMAELYEDGVERLRERIIAFEAPAGPPLDITDQVLQRYCAESGVDFTNIIKDSFTAVNKSDGFLKIDFGIVRRGERGPGTVNAHDASVRLSWKDIESIIQDVKKNGKAKHEKRSGFEYWRKD